MPCGDDYNIIHFQMCFSPVYKISMHGLDINFIYFDLSSVIIDVHNRYTYITQLRYSMGVSWMTHGGYISAVPLLP